MRPLIDGVLVETDVFVEFLTVEGETLLGEALKRVPCYTTVIHAAELFGAADGEEEIGKVRAVLNAIRVLGLSAKYSLTMGAVVREARAAGVDISTRNAFVAGIAMETRLPVLTVKLQKVFGSVPGLTVVSPADLKSSG